MVVVGGAGGFEARLLSSSIHALTVQSLGIWTMGTLSATASRSLRFRLQSLVPLLAHRVLWDHREHPVLPRFGGEGIEAQKGVQSYGVRWL